MTHLRWLFTWNKLYKGRENQQDTGNGRGNQCICVGQLLATSYKVTHTSVIQFGCSTSSHTPTRNSRMWLTGSASQGLGLSPGGRCWDGFCTFPWGGQQLTGAPGLGLQQVPLGRCFLWFLGLVSADGSAFMVRLSVSRPLSHLGQVFSAASEFHPLYCTSSAVLMTPHPQWQWTCYFTQSFFSQEILAPSKV